jgi:hypothetical protein
LHKGHVVAALFALVLPMATAVATGGPAAASPADCLNGANGFLPVPDVVLDAQVIRRRAVEPDAAIELVAGTIGGQRRVWARVSGTADFWLDVSRDGGQSWLRCGPFTADSHQTPAQLLDPAWVYVGCAEPPGDKVPPTTGCTIFPSDV